MPVKAVLIDSASGKELLTLDTCFGQVMAHREPCKVSGVFKCMTFTLQTDSAAIASPDGDGSLELTDLIVSTEKKASGVLTIRFNDGTNTETILAPMVTDAPCNLAMNFMGNWQGWSTAYIEVVISGADFAGAVAIGYVKHAKKYSLAYGDWNARR